VLTRHCKMSRASAAVIIAGRHRDFELTGRRSKAAARLLLEEIMTVQAIAAEILRDRERTSANHNVVDCFSCSR
jgi:hypothetical protein